MADIRSTNLNSFQVGNTANRPTNPVTGQLYFNTDNSYFEVYKSGAWAAIVPIPNAPTSVSATAGNSNNATITFTAPTNVPLVATNSYLVTSSPGNITATGSSSPITISGLTNGTSYTFTVQAQGYNGYGLTSSASNSITAANVVPVDILIVAGGGGGGDSSAGGGGAGGVIYFEGQLLNGSINYSCTVGAGGAGSTGGGNTTSGTDSYFASLTHAFGGGKGGSEGSPTGAAGGSSGGGAWNGSSTSSIQTGTGATAYYGNIGGSGAGAPLYDGAGGGGAGGTGSNGGGGYNGGNGGVGISSISAMTGSTLSTWLSATGLGVSNNIAGGGGGGAGGNSNSGGIGGSGGTGGGGHGMNSNGSSCTAGTANSGGGGGGGAGPQGPPSSNGNGGSGVIIFRYPSSNTITVGSGLTAGTTGTSGSYKYTAVINGTGNVSFS